VLLHSTLTERIIGAALSVHKELGPGLLESAYSACLAHELHRVGVRFETQVRLPLRYRSIHVDAGYRLDFIVENAVVLELKAVEQVLPVHRAQLLSYLRLSGLSVGLLLNFNVVHLRYGIHRMVLSPRA